MPSVPLTLPAGVWNLPEGGGQIYLPVMPGPDLDGLAGPFAFECSTQEQLTLQPFDGALATPFNLLVSTDEAPWVGLGSGRVAICENCNTHNHVYLEEKSTHHCTHCSMPLRIEGKKTPDARRVDHAALAMMSLGGIDELAKKMSPAKFAEVCGHIQEVCKNLFSSEGVFYKFMNGGKIMLVLEPDKINEPRLGRLFQLVERFIEDIGELDTGDSLLKLIPSVGIHTGSVISGILGVQDPRRDYLGSAVNYTARILGAAKNHQDQQTPRILVSTDAQRSLSFATDGTTRIEAVFKGYEGEQTLFEISTQKMATARLDLDRPQKNPAIENEYGVVMALDLSQFTKRTAYKNPDEVIDYVNAFIWQVEYAMALAGGRILERNGDEVVVFFGLQDAEKAVRAAMRVLRRLSVFSEDDPYFMQVKMAMSVGEVSVVDGDMVIAPVIEAAQKLQGKAGQHGLVLSKEMAERVQRSFALDEKEAGVFDLSQAQGFREKYTRPEWLSQERTAEVEALARYLVGDVKESTVILRYTSPHGYGKLDTLAEMFHAYLGDGDVVLAGHATVFKTDPLRDIIFQYLEEKSGSKLNEASIRDLLVRNGMDDDEKLSTAVLVLCDYVGIAVEKWDDLARLRSQKTEYVDNQKNIIAILLNQIAGGGRLVLQYFNAVEIKPEDLEFARQVFDAAGLERVLVLLIDDNPEKSISGFIGDIIFANPLGIKSVNSYLAYRLKCAEESCEDVAREYLGVTRGNFHHLDVLVRHDIQSGILKCESGVVHFDAQERVVPELSALLVANLVHFPDKVRRLFDFITILSRFDGTFKDDDIIYGFGDDNEIDLARSLSILENSGLINRIGEHSYRIAYEAAATAHYRMLAANEASKKEKHQKVARVLGTRNDAGMMARDFALLGYHQNLAGNDGAAIDNYDKAVRRASHISEMFAYVVQMENLRYFGDNLAMLTKILEHVMAFDPVIAEILSEKWHERLLDMHRDHPENLARIYFMRGYALANKGTFEPSALEKAAGMYQMALEMLRGKDVDELLFKIHNSLAVLYYRTGAIDKLLHHNNEAKKHIETGEQDERDKRIALQKNGMNAALALVKQGHYQEARTAFFDLLSYSENNDLNHLMSYYLRVYILINAAVCEIKSGSPSALEFLDNGIAVIKKQGRAATREMRVAEEYAYLAAALFRKPQQKKPAVSQEELEYQLGFARGMADVINAFYRGKIQEAWLNIESMIDIQERKKVRSEDFADEIDWLHDNWSEIMSGNLGDDVPEILRYLFGKKKRREGEFVSHGVFVM